MVFVLCTHNKQASKQERSVWHLEQKWKWTSEEISKMYVEMATLILWNIMFIVWINRLNQKFKIYNRSFSANSIYLKFNSATVSVP